MALPRERVAASATGGPLGRVLSPSRPGRAYTAPEGSVNGDGTAQASPPTSPQGAQGADGFTSAGVWAGFFMHAGNRCAASVMFHETNRSKGQLVAQGIAYDDAMRTWTVSAAFDLATKARRCRMSLLNIADGTVLDLRGALASDSTQMQGSTFVPKSRTSSGSFCLIFSRSCTMVGGCHDFVAANHRKPFSDYHQMSAEELGGLVSRNGLKTCAQRIASGQCGGVAVLSGHTCAGLCELLGVDEAEAAGLMHILANLMYFHQACLTRASTGYGPTNHSAAAAMLRFSLPFTDPLFGLVCGLGGVLTMPLAQIHSYLLTPGEHTRQITGSSINRFWARRSEPLMESIERLRTVAAGAQHSTLCGKDLLLMNDATMDRLGVALAVRELFDFFHEYVYFLQNRDQVIRTANPSALIPPLIKRNAVGSVYAVLRVSPLSVVSRSGKSYGHLALSDEMRTLLRKHERAVAASQDAFHRHVRLTTEQSAAAVGRRREDSSASSTRSGEQSSATLPRHRAAPSSASAQPMSLGGSDRGRRSPASDSRSRAPTLRSGASTDMGEGMPWARPMSQVVGMGLAPPLHPHPQQQQQQQLQQQQQRHPPPPHQPPGLLAPGFGPVSSGAEGRPATSMMRLCTWILTFVSIGLLVVTSVFGAHLSVIGQEDGEKFSTCVVPQLALSVLAICLFMRSHYADHMAGIWESVSKAPLGTYAREMLFVVVQLFVVFFAITQSVQRMRKCVDDREYWHFAHLALFAQRTICLFVILLLDRACPRSRLDPRARRAARSFHSVMVLFAIVSDLAFSLFFILEMPRSGSGTNRDSRAHYVPLSGLASYSSGPTAAHVFPGEPTWLRLLLPIWLLDAALVLWFRQSWGHTLINFCSSSDDDVDVDRRAAPPHERALLLGGAGSRGVGHGGAV